MSKQLLEDILKHSGKKGMKWGIRKKIEKAGSIINKPFKAIRERRTSQLNRFHERNKNKKFYSKKYKRNLKLARGNHETAVKMTGKNIRDRNVKIAIAVVVAARVLKVVATRPETIRTGKNIIQAFKGSPIRFVDGSSSKFKNAINMTQVINPTFKALMDRKVSG